MQRLEKLTGKGSFSVFDFHQLGALLGIPWAK